MTLKNKRTLIETDDFPFEFLSVIGERESWRKEVHRPVYHVHKWWAKRLGSVFRGILIGCALPPETDLEESFYETHAFRGLSVLDPFMGSGTTVGEAHKLGFTAYGRDINPVAVNAVRVSLGPSVRSEVEKAFEQLSAKVGEQIRSLYRSSDSTGHPCDVLYQFWVMQTGCTNCKTAVDLFSSYVFARNAYPNRKPEVQIVCPSCNAIFQGRHGEASTTCPACDTTFGQESGPAQGAKATCQSCKHSFSIIESLGGKRPTFRLYAKLVLTNRGEKEYLPATKEDVAAYEACSARLKEEEATGRIALPSLGLEHGYNTKQAISYGFRNWRDFFNDRQLIALAILRQAIANIPDEPTREALLTLFSGTLEFNNMFASYKGEGTGAVRHMFAHHTLKPERTPIEANVWGTRKSSGAFSTLFKSRLLRAFDYREAPTEVNGVEKEKGRVCSPPFTGELKAWGSNGKPDRRAIYLSCGDSAQTELPDRSIDLVVSDPPFFDNVHYSELADFFFAWQQLGNGAVHHTTRSTAEVQDSDASSFEAKLRGVFIECHRVLKDDGLFVFTYHHSKDEGWHSVAEAILGSGFVVVNSHPVKAEMSVATPKSQAKEPIQLDIILVCRKRRSATSISLFATEDAKTAAFHKLHRLEAAGFKLSKNDRKIVLFGQMLTTLGTIDDTASLEPRLEAAAG